MNAALVPLADRLVEGVERPESNQVVLPRTDSLLSTEPTREDETAERGLYRRSVAYFLFGFGTNRNTIITDEP